MSRKKISQLEQATDVTASDLIQIVDVEDVDMAVSGTNKKATAQLLSDELGKLMNVRSSGSTVSRILTNRLSDVISVKDFGVSGDGTDETAKIQDALNASVGKVLIFGENKTYNITSITIPSGLTIFANGSVFRKITASATPAIVVQGNFSADLLSISSPGSSVDRGIRITGSNINIERIVSTSDTTDSSFGIHFQSTNSTELQNIYINSMVVTNFVAAVLIYYVGFSKFNNIRIQSYRTGVYLRDVQHTSFNDAYIFEKAPSSTGASGSNGVLIESLLSSSSSNNLRFNNYTVVNAGEHSYRLGGNYRIQDVWFTNCRSVLSGAGGDTAAGACGFKVLGGDSAVTETHRDIFFDNCVVEDVSTSASSIGNSCGFLIAYADNVHISNCSVERRSNTYSCWHGYSLEVTRDIFLTNNSCKDARQHALRVTCIGITGVPGFTGINQNINVIGGFYGVFPGEGTASGVCRINSDGAVVAGTLKHMNISGAVFSGGWTSLRAESSVTYQENYFSYRYVDWFGASNNRSTIEGPATGIVYNVIAPWPVTSISAQNTSIYQDITNELVRIRKAGAWVTL